MGEANGLIYIKNEKRETLMNRIYLATGQIYISLIKGINDTSYDTSGIVCLREKQTK